LHAFLRAKPHLLKIVIFWAFFDRFVFWGPLLAISGLFCMQFYTQSSTCSFFSMRFCSLFRDLPSPSPAFCTGSSTGGTQSMRICGLFETPHTQNPAFCTRSSIGGVAPKTPRGPVRQVKYAWFASRENSKKCCKTCFCAQARYSRAPLTALSGLPSEIYPLFTVSLRGRLG